MKMISTGARCSGSLPGPRSRWARWQPPSTPANLRSDGRASRLPPPIWRGRDSRSRPLPGRARTTPAGSPRRSKPSMATATGFIRASARSSRGSTPSLARSHGRRPPSPLRRHPPRRPSRAPRRWRQARRSYYLIRGYQGRLSGHRAGGKTRGKAGRGCRATARQSGHAGVTRSGNVEPARRTRGNAGNAVDDDENEFRLRWMPRAQERPQLLPQAPGPLRSRHPRRRWLLPFRPPGMPTRSGPTARRRQNPGLK